MFSIIGSQIITNHYKERKKAKETLLTI